MGRRQNFLSQKLLHVAATALWPTDLQNYLNHLNSTQFINNYIRPVGLPRFYVTLNFMRLWPIYLHSRNLSKKTSSRVLHVNQSQQKRLDLCIQISCMCNKTFNAILIIHFSVWALASKDLSVLFTGRFKPKGLLYVKGRQCCPCKHLEIMWAIGNIAPVILNLHTKHKVLLCWSPGSKLLLMGTELPISNKQEGDLGPRLCLGTVNKRKIFFPSQNSKPGSFLTLSYICTKYKLSIQ